MNGKGRGKVENYSPVTKQRTLCKVFVSDGVAYQCKKTKSFLNGK